MTDRALLEAAMGSTGLSARALAGVLAVNEATVRRWLMSERKPSARAMPGPARQLCRVLAMEPSVALLLGPD